MTADLASRQELVRDPIDGAGPVTVGRGGSLVVPPQGNRRLPLVSPLVLASSRPDRASTPPELRALLAVQRRTTTGSGLRAATVLSGAGEHAGAWIVLGLLGAAVDRPRRADWLRATGVVVGAHGLSVVVKRVARRVRPEHANLVAHVSVPSRWSFPSSHATSTTAAALEYGHLLGSRLPWAAVPLMAWSRLALGVHYPSDVAAGALLGAMTSVAARPTRRS